MVKGTQCVCHEFSVYFSPKPWRVVDPATSIAFPKVMRIPSSIEIPPLILVGLGVRTVSFLGIKVYSVAFYADLSNPNLKVGDPLTVLRN